MGNWPMRQKTRPGGMKLRGGAQKSVVWSWSSARKQASATVILGEAWTYIRLLDRARVNSHPIPRNSLDLACPAASGS
jgi:hypothetical protein